jgi:DNA-binding Lrp family transcriptional regulator
MKNEYVEDGSTITDEFDLIIKIRLGDIEALDKFVLKYLRTLDEISQTQSMIAYRNVVKE